MSDAVLINVHQPPPIYSMASEMEMETPRHPFRQQALWSASALLFTFYLTLILYLFLTQPPFRHFITVHANALFALPYILSLLVVLLCLAPCTPPPARSQLDAAITTPSDCCLVVLVLLEWATCLALVLVTLIGVHDGLSYVSADGLIVPAPGHSKPIPANGKTPEGIGHDAIVVIIIPVIFMYTLFNFLMHCVSCTQAALRERNGLSDMD